VERRPVREPAARPTRPARRRQPSFRARPYVPRGLRMTA
jgi:hypothetical protein